MTHPKSHEWLCALGGVVSKILTVISGMVMFIGLIINVWECI